MPCQHRAEKKPSSLYAISNNALDLTLENLGIPDPEDREYRVVVKKDAPNTTMLITFTCGSDEYGTGKVFDPSSEQIYTTGVAVQAAAQDSELKVAETRMESWANTTFLIRSPDTAERAFPLLPKQQKAEVTQPKVTLALSPEAFENAAASSSIKEQEVPGTHEVFHSVGQELLELVTKTLGLSEQIEGHIEVLLPQFAETDIAVDVDLNVSGEALLPEERLRLAKMIEQYLNSNPNTREGFATIWVRQGQPKVDTIQSLPKA